MAGLRTGGEGEDTFWKTRKKVFNNASVGAAASENADAATAVAAAAFLPSTQGGACSAVIIK